MDFSIGTMKKTILYHPMGLFPCNQYCYIHIVDIDFSTIFNNLN